MPPAQCPECGRFLAKAFVQGLATEPNDCPKCGLRLSAAHFPETLGQAAAPAGPAEEPAAAAALRHESTPDPDAESVRPPDLDPGDVRVADGADPLEDWDASGGDIVELDQFRAGRRPPPDGAIVAGAGAAGALIGAMLARRWGTGVVVGFAAGVAAAAASRQVWRLPE